MYSSSLNAGWSHLPGRKGLVSGLVVAGNGLGGLIYSILNTSLVNPNNRPSKLIDIGGGKTDTLFPDAVNARVPYMFTIITIIFVIKTILCVAISTFYRKKETELSE